MNQIEWLNGTDPQPMLEYLKGKAVASPRKLRLFVCASLRRAYVQQPPVLALLEVAERFIEGQVTDAERRAAISQFDATLDRRSLRTNLLWHSLTVPLGDNGYRLEWWHYAVVAAAYAKQDQAGHDEVALLRDIFLTPLIRRIPRVPPTWLTWNHGTIARLVQAIYEERELPSGRLDKQRMAILADALSDAGCTDATILDHLRSPAPHVRGCWVIDVLIGLS